MKDEEITSYMHCDKCGVPLTPNHIDKIKQIHYASMMVYLVPLLFSFLLYNLLVVFQLFPPIAILTIFVLSTITGFMASKLTLPIVQRKMLENKPVVPLPGSIDQILKGKETQ